MSLEVSLRRFSLLPWFAQTGNGETRKPHWVGDKRGNPSQPDQNQNNHRDDNPPRRQAARGYRDLADIRLGEVQDAHRYFVNQLLPSPYQSWVARDQFCMLNLVRKNDGRPPALFGRVKACYPSDGYIHNIQDMELYFPNRERKPDTVLLRNEDILLSPGHEAQAYCIRLRCLASPEEAAEFEAAVPLFMERGFLPEFESGYLDLLDLQDLHKEDYPWLYLIGSRWFASIPDSVQGEVRAALKNLVSWDKVLFNYHPERFSGQVRSLNRELGYKPGFTERFLIEPEDPDQTLHIVATTFEKIFQQPIK